MKIGIDIDGTITEARQFFSFLTHVLLESGHEVHIISYREDTREQIRQELKVYNVRYTDIHLPQPNDAMDVWKGKLAEKLDLDIMFDDSPEVLDKMPLKVKRFWMCNPEVINMQHVITGLRAGMRIGVID